MFPMHQTQKSTPPHQGPLSESSHQTPTSTPTITQTSTHGTSPSTEPSTKSRFHYTSPSTETSTETRISRPESSRLEPSSEGLVAPFIQSTLLTRSILFPPPAQAAQQTQPAQIVRTVKSRRHFSTNDKLLRPCSRTGNDSEALQPRTPIEVTRRYHDSRNVDAAFRRLGPALIPLDSSVPQIPLVSLVPLTLSGPASRGWDLLPRRRKPRIKVKVRTKTGAKAILYRESKEKVMLALNIHESPNRGRIQ